MTCSAKLKDSEVKKMARVNNNGVCHYCKNEINKSIMQIEHKTPVHRGGRTTEENIVMSCPRCNTIKSDMNEQEFNYYIENFEWHPNYEKFMIENHSYRVNKFKQKRKMLLYYREVLRKDIKISGFF